MFDWWKDGHWSFNEMFSWGTQQGRNLMQRISDGAGKLAEKGTPKEDVIAEEAVRTPEMAPEASPGARAREEAGESLTSGKS